MGAAFMDMSPLVSHYAPLMNAVGAFAQPKAFGRPPTESNSSAESEEESEEIVVDVEEPDGYRSAHLQTVRRRLAGARSSQPGGCAAGTQVRAFAGQSCSCPTDKCHFYQPNSSCAPRGSARLAAEAELLGRFAAPSTFGQTNKSQLENVSLERGDAFAHHFESVANFQANQQMRNSILASFLSRLNGSSDSQALLAFLLRHSAQQQSKPNQTNNTRFEFERGPGAPAAAPQIALAATSLEADSDRSAANSTLFWPSDSSASAASASVSARKQNSASLCRPTLPSSIDFKNINSLIMSNDQLDLFGPN